jgi:hypothetical protein
MVAGSCASTVFAASDRSAPNANRDSSTGVDVAGREQADPGPDQGNRNRIFKRLDRRSQRQSDAL